MRWTAGRTKHRKFIWQPYLPSAEIIENSQFELPVVLLMSVKRLKIDIILDGYNKNIIIVEPICHLN